jgi:putative ABC transport system permease protein
VPIVVALEDERRERRLVAGRFFSAADRAGGHPVCVVNQSFARREFGALSPLGAVVLRGRDAEQPFEIIGVVADVKTNGPTSDAPDELFLPFRQVPRPNAWIAVRTRQRADASGRLLQAAVAVSNPDLPISQFTTMEDAMAATLGPERILASLTTAFAIAALLLASIGLYAVLAHSVTARTVEIGIRMALGARRRAILQLVVSGAMRLVATGIAFGLVAAVAASRLVAAQLHGVSARDPLVYTVVTALFLMVGAAASLLPARRATRVDPIVSLGSS